MISLLYYLSTVCFDLLICFAFQNRPENLFLFCLGFDYAIVLALSTVFLIAINFINTGKVDSWFLISAYLYQNTSTSTCCDPNATRPFN